MPSRFGPYRAMIYLPLAGLALLGMFLARSRFRELGIFYLMYLTMTAVYSVFSGSPVSAWFWNGAWFFLRPMP